VASVLVLLNGSLLAGELLPGYHISDHGIRQKLPESLRRGLGRDVPGTSQIEWTLTWDDKWNHGLVERHITRTVGDTVWQSNLGDENGYHQRTFRMSPPRGATSGEAESYMFPLETGAGTRNSLLHDGLAWDIDPAERPIVALVEPVETKIASLPLDFSAVGLAMGPNLGGNLFGVQPFDLEGFAEAEFDTFRAGRMEVVTVEFNDRRFEWHLDPFKNGLPVQAMLFRGGTLISQSETTYEQIDGRLFPMSVEFHTRDGTRPTRAVYVEKATFDQPWHMQSISPNDIGILFGTQLWSSLPGGPLRWDGLELLTSAEYHDLTDLYGFRPDPIVAELIGRAFNMTGEEYYAWLDRTQKWRREKYFKEHGTRPWLDEPLGRIPGEKDEWDVYVEQFIKKHKLTKADVKRANQTLDRAKKLRDRYRKKHADDIRKAERDGDEEKLALYEGHKQRVFDEVLVASLNRLIAKPGAGPATERTAKVKTTTED